LSLNHDVPTIEGGSQDPGAGQHQIDALLNEEGEPVWKVLVFDNLGRDVISSVLRVSDLRSKGVTIHL
jgi:sec1 family domain-containing protein 1